MSVNFEKPLSDEQQEIVKEFFGADFAAGDDRTALINSTKFYQREMSDMARKLNQVVTLELNEPGEIITLSDGSRYQVTPEGWRKL